MGAASDTARSKQEVKLFYVLSEGEIQYVDNIFLGEADIRGFKADFAWTPGTIDQKAITGFDVISVGLQSAGALTKLGGAKELGPFSVDVQYVEILFNFQGLYYEHSVGDASESRFLCDVLTSDTPTGGTLVLRTQDSRSGTLTDDLASQGYVTNPTVSGNIYIPIVNRSEKIFSQYIFSIRVYRPLTTTTGWRVFLRRRSNDTDTDGVNQPKANCTITYQAFQATDGTTYSGTAVAAIRIEDLADTNNSIPSVSFYGRGLKVKVPNSAYYNVGTRTYNSPTWDGSFAGARFWTNNLSWILYSLLSDALTRDIPINTAHTSFIPVTVGLGMPESKMAKYTFNTFARYCDVTIHGEKRYSLNGQFITREDSMQAINDMLAVGNAQLAEINGLLSVVYDKELNSTELAQLPIITNEMVLGGKFSYSNSHVSENFTQVNVTINDKNNFNKFKTVVAQSSELVAWLHAVGLTGTTSPYKIPSSAPSSYFTDLYGFNASDIPMKFTNSEASGMRKARRLLWDYLLNNEIVSFKTLIQGSQFYKGKVVKIADSGFNDISSTGRIVSHSVTSGTTTFHLDRQVDLPIGTNYIYFHPISEVYEEIDLNSTTTPYQTIRPVHVLINESGVTTDTVTLTGAFNPIEDSIFVIDLPIIQTYTIVNNMLTEDGYETSAVRYDVNKFSFIDSDYTIPTPTRTRIFRLTNNPVDIVSTDYLTNGTPTKGIHIENNDGTRVNGIITLKWEHDANEVTAAGQSVTYAIDWMLSIAPGVWRHDEVSTKQAEIHIIAPMPNSINLLAGSVFETTPLTDTFLINFIITAKSPFSKSSLPVKVNVLYTINRGSIAMINSPATDDL